MKKFFWVVFVIGVVFCLSCTRYNQERDENYMIQSIQSNLNSYVGSSKEKVIIGLDLGAPTSKQTIDNIEILTWHKNCGITGGSSGNAYYTGFGGINANSNSEVHEAYIETVIYFKNNIMLKGSFNVQR